MSPVGSGLSEALSSRSASEKPLGSVTPFACAQASQRSTLCILLLTIWVRCTVAGLGQRSHLRELAMIELNNGRILPGPGNATRPVARHVFPVRKHARPSGP